MTASSRQFWMLLGLLCSIPLLAQQFSQISGLIRDPSDASVPGATVTVVSEDTGFRRVALSQSSGAYVVASLHPGLYRITVRKPGFRTVVHLGVKLDVASSARVDFLLQVGSLQEQITVDGSSISLPHEDSASGALVGRDWIDRLPLNGRGLLGLLELAPGALITPATRGEAGQFTVNGQRPNTHSFTVDGLTVNNGVTGGGQQAQSTGGSLPGLTAFGSFHHLLSTEALDEFRIQTSTFAPDFGKLPGAQVSLSSRAGANQFHGSFYHFRRQHQLDANDWFANRAGLRDTGSRFNDSGATLGGPLARNRAFFFLSYERLRLRQPLLWRSPVPSADTRNRAPAWVGPLFDLFPPSSGAALGDGLNDWAGLSQRPSRLDTRAARLDYALTSRITLFSRITEAPSRSEFGNTQVNRLIIRSANLSGGLNATLGPQFINDFRFGFNRTRGDSTWRIDRPLPDCYLPTIPFLESTRGVSCDSFFQISIAGLERLISGRESQNRQVQWQLLESVALTRGSHHLRFGVDYRRITPERTRPVWNVQVMAENLADFQAGRNVWVVTTAPEQGRILMSEYSAYAMDSFRASSKLTLTYGLRWEFNPSPISFKPVFGLEPTGSVFSPSKGIPIWRAAYSNLAPRAGFAYRLHNRTATILRAGIGVYYDSSLAAATDLVNGGPFNIWQLGSPASPATGPIRTILNFGFSPELHWPVVRHWNLSLEQPLSGADSFTATYLGSAGRSLLRREISGDAYNSLIRVALTANHAVSDYHALQLQYRRRMARRLQMLATYTWSHSIDTGSSDSALHWLGHNHWSLIDRGNSDFDVRHSLNLAFSLPLRRWSLDGIYRARTGFPINVLHAEHAMGVAFANVFRPDRAPGVPLWSPDASAPGGRRLHRNAFLSRPPLEQGNLGRNSVPGFGMSQLDLSLRREFPLTERTALRFRLEVFNVFNQANFADPVRFLTSPLFGESASMLNLLLGSGTAGSGLAPMLQIGAPRSLQFSFGFHF